MNLTADPSVVKVFLAGDVMTGRGVDQILRYTSDPPLREPYIKDAREYVRLAEKTTGPIPRRLDPAWVWGDALAELERVSPDARIVNLETSVTMSEDYCSDKHIHYRIHPGNIGCLTAARIDVCALANNHVLDFGHSGLEDTLRTLCNAGIKTAGAGLHSAQAFRPAAVDLLHGGRIVVASVASPGSGVPKSWAATSTRPGVALLPELSVESAAEVAAGLLSDALPGDITIVSIHWGSNWGYEVPAVHRRFAHRLIDLGVDVVHGHSSHHPRPLEVYRGRLILYGCGDLITDYEGISGKENFRGELGFLYLAMLAAGSGELAGLSMSPVRVRRMRLERGSEAEARWLAETMNRWCEGLGSALALTDDTSLRLGQRE